MTWFQFGVTAGVTVDVQQFTFRQPVFQGKRAAIAQAAYEAGFDCSKPDKLLHLVDAVATANNKFGYPDRWDGPAAFQSTIYPDHWTPAHASRKAQASGFNKYEEYDRHPAVPAFAAPAADIVRNLKTQSKHASGSNRQPLGERSEASINSMNKRLSAPLPDKPTKRFKTEVSGSFTYITTSSTHVTSIGQINPQLPARPMSSNTRRPLHRNIRRPGLTPHQPNAITQGTEALLKRVAAKIKTNVLSINAHRDGLRDRWDVDHHLKLNTITDYFRAVNEYFNESEKALDAAVQVVEKYIVPLYILEAS
ncbi:MAG: hypothetical protein Q9209_000072 [Squamulea sp. 1 TL-2023]